MLGNYTSIYCKDKTPAICENLLQSVYNGDRQRFEDEYCSASREQEIQCLKTCHRCLSKSKTISDQDKNFVLTTTFPHPTIVTTYPTSISTMSTTNDGASDVNSGPGMSMQPLLSSLNISTIILIVIAIVLVLALVAACDAIKRCANGYSYLKAMVY